MHQKRGHQPLRACLNASDLGHGRFESNGVIQEALQKKKEKKKAPSGLVFLGNESRKNGAIRYYQPI